MLPGLLLSHLGKGKLNKDDEEKGTERNIKEKFMIKDKERMILGYVFSCSSFSSLSFVVLFSCYPFLMN